MDSPASPGPRQLWAFPLAFLGAWGLVSTDLGGFIGSTCFGMWLHELGHAASAWVCGHWALPLPWFTYAFGENRLVSALVFGGAALLVRAGWRGGSRGQLAAGAALGAAALVGHLLSPVSREVLFVFGGTAGALVLGAGLACAFLLPPEGSGLRGGLRWGWLAIGAISWADAAHLWVLVRRDPANLPLGLENGTESDATKLVDRLHWSEEVLVSRTLQVAAVTLACALLAWAWTAWRARTAATS
jgi:hypothetical protein